MTYNEVVILAKRQEVDKNTVLNNLYDLFTFFRERQELPRAMLVDPRAYIQENGIGKLVDWLTNKLRELSFNYAQMTF